MQQSASDEKDRPACGPDHFRFQKERAGPLRHEEDLIRIMEMIMRHFPGHVFINGGCKQIVHKVPFLRLQLHSTGEVNDLQGFSK